MRSVRRWVRRRVGDTLPVTVHQAGGPVGLVQVCGRCQFILLDWRDALASLPWVEVEPQIRWFAPGSLIIERRIGGGIALDKMTPAERPLRPYEKPCGGVN